MARLSLGATPKNMRVRRQSTGGRLLVVLCALSLVLIAVSVGEGPTGPLHGLRSALTVLTSPVKYIGSAISSPFVVLVRGAEDASASPETLSDLKEENARLTAELTQLKEAEHTASRLEALLGLKNTYKLNATSARIVSGATDSLVSSITIDKGSSSGLAVGMPVTNAAGVIGQIIECGYASSLVRLMTDEQSSISAMVQSSRAQGMVVGSADGNLSLTRVRTDQAVEVGDLVITSGIGAVYPKGLPLAKVTRVNKPQGALYYEIGLTALGSLNDYEEVLVITSLSTEQQANADDVSEADGQDAAASTPTTAPTVMQEQFPDSSAQPDGADGTDASQDLNSEEEHNDGSEGE